MMIFTIMMTVKVKMVMMMLVLMMVCLTLPIQHHMDTSIASFNDNENHRHHYHYHLCYHHFHDYPPQYDDCMTCGKEFSVDNGHKRHCKNSLADRTVACIGIMIMVVMRRRKRMIRIMTRMIMKGF